MKANRRLNVAVLVVLVAIILILCGDAMADFTFGPAQNLGPTLNTTSADGGGGTTSAGGLELYFCSDRPGGSGATDICVSKRQSVKDPWGPPANLGPMVNSPYSEDYPSLSSDGLTLYFSDFYSGSPRPGGLGGPDIWMTTRPSRSDPWTTPVNLDAPVNNSSLEISPTISGDGLTLVFTSNRNGGMSGWDLVRTLKRRFSGLDKKRPILILLTAWGVEDGSKHDLLKAGVDRVLSKPISIEDLVHYIKEILSRNR